MPVDDIRGHSDEIGEPFTQAGRSIVDRSMPVDEPALYDFCSHRFDGYPGQWVAAETFAAERQAREQAEARSSELETALQEVVDVSLNDAPAPSSGLFMRIYRIASGALFRPAAKGPLTPSDREVYACACNTGFSPWGKTVGCSRCGETIREYVPVESLERFRASYVREGAEHDQTKQRVAEIEAAGEGLALVTRRRLRGDATTSETLRLALCAWDEAK